MPRRRRIHFDGAVNHVMSRGNARRDTVDDDDRQQFQDRPAAQAARLQWQLIGFVLVHLGKEEVEADPAVWPGLIEARGEA